MSMAEIEIKKWGNSAGIVLPKAILEQEDVGVGDIVKIEVTKRKKVDGFGMWKGLNLPPFEREHEEHEW